MSAELNPLPRDPTSHASELVSPEAAWPSSVPSLRRGSREPAGDMCSTADEVLSPTDMELIEVVYGFVIREARCATCRHPFSSTFRVKVHDCGGQGAWMATVSSRCNGLRRHRSDATAWVSNDGLRLGSLRRSP